MKHLLIVLCYVGFSGNLFGVNNLSVAVYRTHTTKTIHNTCPPINIEHGFVKRRARGRVARFFCLRGYLLAGEKLSTCVRGKWDPEFPRCVRPTCKSLSQQNMNGNILIYPTHSGAVQHFFCKAGNYLNGPRDIYCNGTVWSNNVPTCIPNNQNPKLSCDFEDPSLCGWTHDPNHDFDWKRENYNTPSGSIGTGPSYDHTKGKDQDGYYMYIESSSKAENDSARLISPVYNIVSDNLCFKFYYHMFGATIGTLRVYLKTVNETWKLDPKFAFFSKSRNQGDKWHSSLTHLGNITDQFQIIVEGVRGNGYVSDIAIDDVEIISDCENEEEFTTMISSTDNEFIPIIDTCENRCGQKENITELYHLTCDCDDDCFVSNRCCPDYYDTCADNTDPDDFETTSPKDELRITDSSNVKIYESTFTSTTKQATTTLLTKRLYTTRTILPTTTLTPKASTRFRHAIYFKTPPATPQILRKTTTTIIPTYRYSTQYNLVRDTRPKLTSATTPRARLFSTLITTSKPKYRHSTQHYPVRVTRPKIISQTTLRSNVLQTTTPTTLVLENADDMLEVPKPTNIDELLYGATSASKEFWSDEIENNIDAPYTRNFGESTKLFSQIRKSEEKPHLVILVLSTCSAVVLISLVVFIIIRRYRFSRRILQSSNGESQSDVRYLTNSDVLDLSLANTYEELLN